MSIREDIDALRNQNLSEKHLKEVMIYLEENFPNTYSTKPNESNIIPGGENWYQRTNMIISCEGCKDVGRISRVKHIPTGKEWYSSEKGIENHEYIIFLDDEGVKNVAKKAKKPTIIEGFHLIPGTSQVKNVVKAFKEHKMSANMCNNCIKEKLPNSISTYLQNLSDQGANLNNIKIEIDGDVREVLFLGKKRPVPLKPKKF